MCSVCAAVCSYFKNAINSELWWDVMENIRKEKINLSNKFQFDWSEWAKKLMNKLLECYWVYWFGYWFWYVSAVTAAGFFVSIGTFRCNTFRSANDPNQYVRSHFLSSFFILALFLYWNSRRTKTEPNVGWDVRIIRSGLLASCLTFFSGFILIP